MKKRNLKIGLIVLLVMLMLGLTYTSFAFWDQLTKTDDITVNIGEGKEISIDVTVNDNSGTDKLIPVGTVKGPNEVYQLTVEFEVTLDNQTQSALNLSVNYSDVLIDGTDTYSNLVDITITPTSTIQYGTPVTGTATITLTEPNDDAAGETAYSAISGKPITFTLTFKATQGE